MEKTDNPRLFLLDNKNLISDTLSPTEMYGIMIHHAQYTVEDDSLQLAFAIDRWHDEKGWGGIGYSYVVERNGNIYKTHHAINGTRQAHSAEVSPGRKYIYNIHFVGICLSTHGDKQEISNLQLDSMNSLITALVLNNPIQNGMLFSHSMVSEKKTCPGFFVHRHFSDFYKAMNEGIYLRGI